MPLKAVKTISVLSFVVAATVSTAYAQFLYPSSLPRVSTPWADTPYDSVLSKTWQGIRKTLVDDFGTGMVHRPKSNMPGDAVSEGISYGMFLALYVNDQEYFDKIWDAGERYMWNDGGGFYDWRVNRGGEITGTGPASDADQDIALLLIFADELVKAGIWKPFTSMRSATYESRARDLLHVVRTQMVADNGALAPGAWGKEAPGTINPGYFAPAFYRIFAEFDPTNAAAWNALVESSYDMLAKSPGYERGLLPDWFQFDGSSTGGAGYNAYFSGDALYRDAIRIYWRLATDWLWYGERRAKAFLDNAMKFMEGLGGPGHADFFDMDGNLFPENHVELLMFDGENGIPRSRREHSHLTLGMWAAAAMGSGGPALAQKYSDALLGFYEPGTTYWGRAVDPTGGRVIENAVAIHPTNQYADPIELGTIEVFEDTLHNEMYFDQFLAWFGASILAGNFTNVWDDLKYGVPQGPPSWVNRPSGILPNWDINAEEEPFMFKNGNVPVFSHAARWTVEFKHDSTGISRTFSGRSDTVNVTWYGTNADGGYMTQGWYTLTLLAEGLEYKTQVWLGKPWLNVPNLMIGDNRLLVDDFKDGDIYPYIGSRWSVTTGGSSTAEITFPVAAERLTWSYSLGGNYNPSTLDWVTEEVDVSDGVIDTLIIWASSQNAGLDVWLHILSAHFSTGYDKFFEHTFTLSGGTSPQKITIPLKADEFAQRQYVGGPEPEFTDVLKRFTGLRFHMQDDMTSSLTGAITLDSIIFVGSNVGRLYEYAPPPEYIAPDGEPQVGISHRPNRRMPDGFSIRKTGNTIRIATPRNMAGASVSMVNLRGRTVKRMTVPSSGIVNINARDLASGMYFVEVRKPGVSSIKMPLRLAR